MIDYVVMAIGRPVGLRPVCVWQSIDEAAKWIATAAAKEAEGIKPGSMGPRVSYYIEPVERA